MDTLNLQEEDPSAFENFVHRNTRTEISNFEGSFRPCLFSRIESSSSFESSFENSGEDFSDIIKEERPLSKSYKPDSVLKASFLTERQNSPSFKEFESRNIEKEQDFLGTFKSISPKDLSDKKNRQDSLESRKTLSKKEEISEGIYKNDPFSNQVVQISAGKNFLYKPSSKDPEKESFDDKFLTLIDIITQKDEEIKDLRTQLLAKDKEISENSGKTRAMQAKLAKTTEELAFYQQNFENANEKFQKSEAQVQKLQVALAEAQKDLAKKQKIEDRIRKAPDEGQKPEKLENKLKELASENEYLKAELQKRPSFSQYQSALSRIEELEGMLSQRKTVNCDKSELEGCKALFDMFKVKSFDELVEVVKSLKNPNANSKLILRISNLIQDCVPPGTFKNGPGHRDIWKFIRNVMESYIQLKKSENNLVISKIQGCLGVGESANIYQEVLKIYNSLHFMELVFDKLKAKLGLSPHATTQEVENSLDQL